MAFEPRYYQRDAFAACAQWMRNGGKRGVAVLPTGAGKSPLAGMIANAAAANGHRTLILTHVSELVQQDAEACLMINPRIDVGINAAKLRSRQMRNQVIVASINSIYQRPEDLGSFRVIIVDEAHMVSRKDASMYVKALSAFQSFDPRVRVIGLSATPYRMDSGHICEPYEDAEPPFLDIFYEVSIRELIEKGFLSPMIARRTTNLMVEAARDVKTTKSDYVAGALEEAVNHDEINNAVVSESLRLGGDRRTWLTFACGKSHARALADAFNAAGIQSAVLTDETPDKERRRIVAAHKAGGLRNVVNVGVATTGYDCKQIDFLSIARPTKSRGLFYQIAGRGFRIAPGKQDCLVADFGGNIGRHGPLDLLDVPIPPRKGKKKDILPPQLQTRICMKCEVIYARTKDACPECGTPAPKGDREASLIAKLTTKASSGLLVSDGSLASYVREGQEAVAVNDMRRPAVHMPTDGRTSSLRITYDTVKGCFSLYLKPLSGGYMAKRARDWWDAHVGRNVEMPNLPDDMKLAIEQNWQFLNTPEYLVTQKDESGYSEIKLWLMPGAVKKAA